MSSFDQLGHQLDHFRDVPGRARLVGRQEAAEDLVGVVERPLVGVGHRPPRPPCLVRLGQNLVVDVGDVGNHGDFVAGVLEPAT